MNDTPQTTYAEAQTISTIGPKTTVGEMLDIRIQTARKQVETLCILKAKAEASGILEFPHSFVCEVAWS